MGRMIYMGVFPACNCPFKISALTPSATAMKTKTRYHCPHLGCKKSYTRRDYVERHAVNREYECNRAVNNL